MVMITLLAEDYPLELEVDLLIVAATTPAGWGVASARTTRGLPFCAAHVTCASSEPSQPGGITSRYVANAH